jgi:hypothetical protein
VPKNKHNPNMSRVARARVAIKGYAGEFHDLEANITDVLCDLRHLCAAKQMDFDHIDKVAKMHFEAENKLIKAQA